MKTKTNHHRPLILVSAVAIVLSFGLSIKAADVFWEGYDSSDWSDTNNWANGFPTNSDAGNAIITAAYPCIVSNGGNYTQFGVYVSAGGDFSIISGGQLNVATTFVTGVFGDHPPVNITGQLTIGQFLNIGASGQNGKVNIFDGGTVQSSALAINGSGGAWLNISTNGTYTTSYNQLANINTWIGNNSIVANANTSGWSINVDTNTIAGKVVLTAVYVPPPTPTNFVFNNGGGDMTWTNQLNWNPVGQPHLVDPATVDGGFTVILNSGTEGFVGKLTVGTANGQGTVNFNTNCNVSFRDSSISLIIGGTVNSGNHPSSCIFNGGNVGTVGDFVLGGSGGRVDARHYAGSCHVGGTLRLGSYLYSGTDSPTNASLRLIGSSGGFNGIGAIEIGNAGTLSYEFNGGNAVKTLSTAGGVNILPGAALVIDGTGYSGLTTDIILMKGSTFIGTFTTVVLTNFPNSVTSSVSYTGTGLKLSLINDSPNLGLAIQHVGGTTNRVTWNLGNIETAPNVSGPWQLNECASSPLIQIATVAEMFYRGVLYGTTYKFDNETGNNQWGYASNWNPDGIPGPSDDTVIDNAITVFVVSDVGTVGSVTVGKFAGNGSLQLNDGASIVFTNPCKSVIIGGASGQPVNFYRQGNGSGGAANMTTVGDFVFGSSGGGANAIFAGPGTLSIGGVLRLGSDMSPAYSFFQLLGANGTVSTGALEVGSAGDLQFNFNGDANLNTLLVSGIVSLLPGSTLTVNGSLFVGGTGTYNYTLVQGGSRSGTFTTVNVVGFPAGVTAAVSYSGGNVNLTVTVP